MDERKRAVARTRGGGEGEDGRGGEKERRSGKWTSNHAGGATMLTGDGLGGQQGRRATGKVGNKGGRQRGMQAGGESGKQCERQVDGEVVR